MGGFEWNCRNCTYHHKSHATRCQMCNELRVSREEMRSFVTGGGQRVGNASNYANADAQGGANANAHAQAAAVGRPAQHQQSRQPQPQRNQQSMVGHASGSSSGGPNNAAAAAAAAAGPVNPYLASSGGRRPMPANSNAHHAGAGAGGGANARGGAGGGGVLNPYASHANANNANTNNVASGTSSSSGSGRPTNSGIGSAGSGSGPHSTNAVMGRSSVQQQQQQQQQRPPSGNPYNPYGQQQQRQSRPGSSGGGGGSASGGAVANNNIHVNIMNPPPPRQPVMQQQQQMNQQGRVVASATNNPYQQRQQQQPSRPYQQQQQPLQQSQNRGPTNPYAQQSMNTNTRNNSSNRRTLPKPPQQQRQSVGPGTAALLANTSRQNPWTVAEANAATKQSLQYRPGPVPLDEEAARTWIYPDNPTHRPREYQVQATEEAILRNTLVSLPTGLGKTLIAAVTMYNFYRWFPTGKVVFCAPTKPLVSQQLTSCYEILGVPAQHTAEIMGETTKKDDRARYWQERRLFFCTPQTIENDIDAGRCDPKSIVCVVIDEAHRAKGKYAYVKLVEKITQSGAKFRVLALSATPGTTQKAIGEVVENLLISKIFAKSDEDADVKRYIHNREEDVILVKQTEAIVLIERLLDGIITPFLDKLRSSGAIPNIRGSIPTITSQRLRDAQKEYNDRVGNVNNNLTFVFRVVCLLIECRIHIRASGISTTRRSLESMQQQSAFGKITKSDEFQALWREVEKLTIGGGGDDHAANLKANNPKLQKLDEVLCKHFGRASSSGESSKVIVFTELRGTIRDILSVIECRRPLVRPHMFIGQGVSSKKGGDADDEEENRTDMAAQGMKQKQQQEVIKRFRQGDYNVLVATSIGEEGLDIGEVDLIVNFTTSRSCTRMIQRMGRTGRKRQGRVISLVSEGKEQTDREKAKSDQARLNRILKDPAKARDLNAKITMRPALIPGNPSRQMRDMNVVAEAFRLSQVAGYSQKKKKRNANGAASGRNAIDNDSWRLRPSQDTKRVRDFGGLTQTDRYSSNPLSSKPTPFPVKLRREYIRKRSSKLTETSTRGTSSSILSMMETKFLDSNKTSKTWQRRARLGRRKEKRPSRCDRIEKEADRSVESVPEREFASRLQAAARDPSPEKEASHANFMEEDDDDANVYMLGGDDDDDSVRWNQASFEERNAPAPDTIEAGGDQNNAGPLDDVFGSMQDMSIQDSGRKSSSSRLSSNVLNSIFSGIDGEGRTVLPPPTLDGSSGMYFMEEYQSPEVSEDDASERLDTPTRDVGIFSMNIDASKPPTLDLPPPPPRPEATSGFHDNYHDDDDDQAPFEADDDDNNFDVEHQGKISTVGVSGVQVQPLDDGESARRENVSENCEIQININTDDSSSSYSDEEDDSDEEESKAKAGEGGAARGERDDANDNTMQEDTAPLGRDQPQEADNNPPNDMQVPESVFVPIDLEALRAQGVSVNASPPQEFRVSIATQESSSSDSSSSASSSCCNADEDPQDDAKTDGHDFDDKTNEDEERISPKAIAATSDTEFPSQSQSSTKSSDSVASQAAQQAVAGTAANPSTDVDNEVSVAAKSSLILLPPSQRQPVQDRHTVEGTAENSRNNPVENASIDPDVEQLDVEMDCVDTAKQASAPNPSLTDSVDCTPMIFRKGKPAKGGGQRRKVLFSPASITTQESTSKNNTGGRRMSKPGQNYNLSAAQGLLDTPDKSVADKEECDEIVCAICHCSNSPVSDPIVLCDGDSGSCNLAVHKSCYNIGPSLDMIDEWRCDRCQDTGGKPACSICKQTGGALQRTPCNEAWAHSVCVFWSSQYANMLLAKAKSVPDDGFCGDLCKVQDLSEASFGWVPPIRCDFCSKDRAVRCCVSGCQASAHPFCASTNSVVASSRWTLLHHKGETDGTCVDVASSRLWWHMFCPNHTDEAKQALTRFRLLPRDDQAGEWTRPCLKCIYYRGRGEDVALCNATSCDGDGDQTSKEKNEPSRKRRLRKKSAAQKESRKQSNDASTMEIDLTIDTSRKRLKGSPDKKRPGKSGKDKLRERVSVFFDTEAAIDSDDEDGSDEERELRALEEDELSHDSFINDSSQLGSCSQDDLDRIREKTDMCAPSRQDVNDATLHRELDVRREREQEFATPMLNRRNKNCNKDDDSVGLSQSVDSSQRELRGLGIMAFIRSVLEHHKAGGNCDQIEDEYHRLAQEEAEGNNADTEQQESLDSVMDSAKPPVPHERPPQMNQEANTRATGAAVPSHQQGPGQGRPSPTKAAASSSFFAPRQKPSATTKTTTAAPTASMPSAPPASSKSDDAWEAHATANRREAGIAIPTNNPNIGRHGPTNNLAAPRHHGAGNRIQGPGHLFNSSASVPPPRTHGTTNRQPFPPRQNAPGGSIPRAGVPNGLAPATNNSNRPQSSSGGTKSAGLTDEQRARMEENRRKALLRKQQRQQQMQQQQGHQR